MFTKEKNKKKKHKRINNNFNLSKRIILQAKLIETREESCLNAVERLFGMHDAQCLVLRICNRSQTLRKCTCKV